MTRYLAQRDNWSCFACCLAMATDVELEHVYETVGHDGSAIVEWSEHPDKRRGILLSEAIIYLAKHQKLMGGYFGCHDQPLTNISIDDKFAWEYPARGTPAIVTVLSRTSTGLRHCVYWDGHRVYDPMSPEISQLSAYDIVEFWPILEITVYS